MRLVQELKETGARLPIGQGALPAALARLRRLGVGERVIKTALAASLAWAVAGLIPDNPRPVLAPLTAIFTIQLTVAGSLRGSIQRILGVLCGVGVAVLAAWLVGIEAWSIGVVILFTLAVGRRLKLEAAGVEQMTVSALLVLLIGAGADFAQVAALHVVNTLVGTAVGLALNGLIAPPSYVPDARLALRALGERVVHILDDLSAGIGAGIGPDQARSCLVAAREASSALARSQAALVRAEESLLFNLFARQQRERLAVYRRANRALEHAAIQTRIIARSVADATSTAPSAFHAAWTRAPAVRAQASEMVAALAVALHRFIDLADDPDHPAAFHAAVAEVRRQRIDCAVAARLSADLCPDGWILLGQLLAVADQLAADLADAASALAALADDDPTA